MDISNCFLLNWGQVNVPKSNSPANSVFSMSYTTACLQAVTNLWLNSGEGMRSIGVKTLSTTEIDWEGVYTASSARTGMLHWLALGY